MGVWDTIRNAFGNKQDKDVEMIRKIIINIRVPRTIASVMIGGILAVAGCTYQCVFRNTLVSQDILGISTGACVGAALGIILGWSTIWIQGLSFAVGMLAIALVFLLSSKIKLDKTISLVLSGILISGAMSSVLALIKYLANPETHLQAIVFWTMGDISSVSIEQLGYITIPVALCLAFLMVRRWDLNYFCYSDGEARSLGVNIGALRIGFILCATVLVACAVSISGSIGWIGLVIPQLARLLVGTNNKHTLPLSFLMGSVFLLIVDLINRMISAAELPVSIISGMLGLPIFIICWLASRKHEHSEAL